MPPNTTWSELNKSQTKFNYGKSEWKQLESKYLMKTEILPDFEKSEEYTRVDPNVLMNMRHEMVKPYFSKSVPASRKQIQTYTTKLLKEENHKKLLKNKEEKSVRREINKLQLILQNHRFIGKTENEFKPKFVNASKFEKPIRKFRKKFESFEEICEVDNWLTELLPMMMETKKNEIRIPFDVKVYLKRKKKNENNCEDFSDRISCQKGSVFEATSPKDRYPSWDCETDAGKKEIMIRFFRSEVLKTEFKLHNQTNLLKDEKTEKLNQNKFKVKKKPDKKENLIKIHTETENKRRLFHAWKVWRLYILTCQKRQKERILYENKVDKFIVKLQEQTIQDLQPQKKINKCLNFVEKSSFRSKSSKILSKEILKKEKDKEKDEKLLTIVKSIKESQKEAHGRLVTIEEKTEKAKVLKVLTNIFETVKDRRKAFSNPNFLLRMEKRREERNARRREIEERKRIREEEKEKAHRKMEEENKQMRQQEKRREFEKLIEKRRQKKERREQEKKEREKFKVLSTKASEHYKKVLLRSYGLIPWLKLMQVIEERMDTATAFAEKIVTRKAFCTWAANVRCIILQKRENANDFYRRTLQKKWFRLWMEFSRERTRQLQVAIDWQELRLTDWAFCKWLDFTQEEQLTNLSKQGFADLHFEKKLKQKYLKNLKNYPEKKKLQLASENRRRMLRQKVLQILPDYKPINICTNS